MILSSLYDSEKFRLAAYNLFIHAGESLPPPANKELRVLPLEHSLRDHVEVKVEKDTFNRYVQEHLEFFGKD